MASRHEQLRREEPLPTLALDELEQRLHASGVTVSGDDSGNVGRLERSGFREPYSTEHAPKAESQHRCEQIPCVRNTMVYSIHFNLCSLRLSRRYSLQSTNRAHYIACSRFKSI